MGLSVALIEEGAQQEDDGDVLVVTEALPSTAPSTGQSASGQGALVRNILEAEKALQVALRLDAASSSFGVLIVIACMVIPVCGGAAFVDLKMQVGAIQRYYKHMAKALH